MGAFFRLERPIFCSFTIGEIEREEAITSLDLEGLIGEPSPVELEARKSVAARADRSYYGTVQMESLDGYDVYSALRRAYHAASERAVAFIEAKRVQRALHAADDTVTPFRRGRAGDVE